METDEHLIIGRHPQLDEILGKLRDELQNIYGDRLAHFILYGSQARGDAEKYSDIDIMIVLKHEFDSYEESKHTLQFIADLSLEYSVVISRIFISEDRFLTGDTGLLQNVRQEGIEVT
ncbi:MAG TPA: nucleotidyltransferase domain-containing protein [Aggregatilineales bacterium]|nr:nucleotidyltransferase domain-containing protein [Aggregatilineales bacterium]